MDKETRNRIERATQAARGLLEQDFADQLEGVFDIRLDGTIAAEPGSHLDAAQRIVREKLVAAVEHARGSGFGVQGSAEAVRAYLREAAFTTLNRFVALKMLEARGLVQECVSRGEQSAGFKEFCGLAPGLVQLPDHGYRLYIESLFDELSTEVKVLFDRRDPYSVLWPKRATFEQLLEILNATELSGVWGEDETIGWVYQFFNGQDERRKMREESQAPRNSRELAVRNQFFTPRYVVQFLTDNTLGRIWYEMRGTKTALTDQCEYMVRTPGEAFAPRAKKDPRDLRVLDPACGSGHFLLYAFDLLIAIYEEAWADPASPRSEATGRTLAEDYPSLDALRRAVPGLVLAHNLHGVDIDPRCAQIAQLALWMRAQKANRDFGIGRAHRPQIRRSNIVVAEPLVADEQIAKEFVAKLDDPELGRVFLSLVESLNLAGELGLLLRVEQLAGRQAKPGQTGDLFAPPEERIRAALDRFVREEASVTSTRRRLFADDAAHGVALLSVAEKKFDAVLMNPPFGDPTTNGRSYLSASYSNAKHDLACCFFTRGAERLNSSGMIGCISTRTPYFLPTSKKWREALIEDGTVSPKFYVDLGLGALDAMVETALVVATQSSANEPRFFTSMPDEQDRPQRLTTLVRDLTAWRTRRLAEFAVIDGAPFCYWVDSEVLRLYVEWPALSVLADAKQGLATTDDFRTLRLWWELTSEVSKEWKYYAKGGEQAAFESDLHLCVRWSYDGAEVKALVLLDPTTKHWSRRVAAAEFYGKAGLTWAERTHWLSLAPLPRDTIFGVSGKGLFLKSHTDERCFSLAATGSSTLSQYMLRLSSGALEINPKYQAGDLQRLPISPELLNDKEIAALQAEGWQLAVAQTAHNEASTHYVGPAVPISGESWSQFCDRMSQCADSRSQRLGELFRAIDDRVETAARLSSRTRQAIREGLPSRELKAQAKTSRELAEGVLSFCVGKAFGRYGALANTSSGRPPFSSIPLVSPRQCSAMAARPILVDDEGHDDDIASVAATELAGLLRSSENEAEVLRAVGVSTVREWSRSNYFDYHIKGCTRGRRRAPFYWQLATPSACYSVWLYIHAFSNDTLFRVQNDYVAPKLAHEERRLETLTAELRDGATAVQRKELAEQQALVEELRAFLAEVRRVAPLWKPNLDDGVIINFAPLWRLVPQNKAWQKELKSTWDALCEGKYDWAHLAMHLWSERVVPKCAKDRSLAIAHGLEDVFWEEDADGKWRARVQGAGFRVQEVIDRLVAERTSAAVKDALKGLLEAPAPVTGRGGGRRSTARGPSRRAGAASRAGDGGRARSSGGASAAVPDAATLDAVRQAIAADNGGVSKSDVLAATGLTDAQWNVAINTLLADGAVTKTGAARGTRYHLNPEP